jgi:apolipoprotein N-acyltransferase
VAPAFHWTPASTAAQIREYIQSTDAIGSQVAPALIVWPEYAVPRYLDSEPSTAMLLAATARRHHADLLFGAPRREGTRSFNSASLITHDGRSGGHYDKRRLVLLAERTPFSSASDNGQDVSQFSAGHVPGVLSSFARLGVSICHEIIYPEAIADSVTRGAEILVNIANDSWTQNTSGSVASQHLAMAVLRSIETRRYLVRAAPTGVSAIVDPFGRVISSIPEGHRGVTTARVAGIDTLTTYVRYGDTFAVACVILGFAGLLFAVRRADASPVRS